MLLLYSDNSYGVLPYRYMKPTKLLIDCLMFCLYEGLGSRKTSAARYM